MTAADGGTLRFTDFIRERGSDILAAWEVDVRRLPVARDLDRLILIDHIPDLLERIAEIAEELAAGRTPTLPANVAELHAIGRLDKGYDLKEVVVEYAILRDCVLRLWETTVRDTHVGGVRALDQAIDTAVTLSVERYMAARDRTLQALDRIATAALESTRLDTLLHRLVSVLKDTTVAVDTAAILLRDGDVLQVRAVVGLDERLTRGFEVRIGEGFAGTIASEAQPRALRDASTDPRVKSPALRAAGVRALYGVPLIDNGVLIGVAHMGSRTANEFSAQDKRLFGAMANRATSAIVHHMLREAAEIQAIEAREGVRAREQVLAIVSHDLRNPLGAIGMSTAMLLETTQDRRARKQLEIIRRSANRMEHMISDLLDMASIQAGRLALDMKPEDADQLIAEIPDFNAPLAAERGITLELASHVQGITVLCDHDRISQVFANLMGNAIKFCRRGDVITLRADPDGDSVRYVVDDTGPGIAEAHLAHIFEPYWSAKPYGRQGIGLGLYISKGIIEAHNGHLRVETTLGSGTSFIITLPVIDEDVTAGSAV